MQRALLTGALALVMVLAGCQSVYDVTIDAISNVEKPLGTSYRLEVYDPSGGVDKELQSDAITHVRIVLAARGLYEAPPGTQPDMDIHFEYGVSQPHIKFIYQSNNNILFDSSLPQKPGSKPIVVYEKFIKLSAREPAPVSRGGRVKPGPEIWSVQASVEDPKKDLAPYLPVLAAAAIAYIGQNPPQEQHLSVKSKEVGAMLGQGNPTPAPVH